MARTLDRFDFTADGKYPWSTWLDGQIWQLERGEDFDCKPHGLVTSARIAARKRDKEIDFKVDGDTVTIRATPPDVEYVGGR